MAKIIDRFNSLSSTIKAVGTVLGWFGWTTAATSTALALGTGLGAWFENLPYTVIWTCGLTVLVMSIFLIKFPKFYNLIKQASPNAEPSEVWRMVPTFSLSQAASLFAGIEPVDTPFIPLGPAVPWYVMLRDAVLSGEIERIPDPPQDAYHIVNGRYQPHVGTQVRREELQKFAKKRNKNAAFLLL